MDAQKNKKRGEKASGRKLRAEETKHGHVRNWSNGRNKRKCMDEIVGRRIDALLRVSISLIWLQSDGINRF